MSFTEIKKLLHQRCIAIINERISVAKQAMDDAQASANQEEKSSAGDKYETSRAMAQIARDQAAQQLDDALQLKNVLERTAVITTTDKVSLGSLVITDQNRFYISISIGKIVLNGEEYLAISPQSPIGKLLTSHTANDEITFNNKKQVIRAVY